MTKKIILSSLVLIAGIAGYVLLDDDNSSSLTPESQVAPSKWLKKYPQLGSNAGFNTLAESASPYQSKTASQQELIGKVTNQFGIRDDVLKLIMDTIPESDVRSTIAAIKMAQFYQQQIGVTDDSKINNLANKAGAADSCINISLIDKYNFITNYDKIIRDTPTRQAEWDRIEHLLSNHVISNDYGIQSYNLKEQCDHFLGESK